MKYFNRILFVCSFFMIGTVCAMEKEKKTKPTINGNRYIELDSKQNAQLVKHVGGGLGYYGQYDAQRDKNNNSMLFPIKFIDSLPIRYCGNKRFFITSATEEKKGSALTILDPAITQLVAVRGFVQKNGWKVNLYLGFEADNVKICDNKRDRIHPARIMTVQIANWDVNYAPEKKEVEDFDIIAAIRQERDKPKDDKSFIYTHQIKLFLGASDALAQYFDFEKQCFNFDDKYWPDKENKLKTIACK